MAKTPKKGSYEKLREALTEKEKPKKVSTGRNTKEDKEFVERMKR